MMRLYGDDEEEDYVMMIFSLMIFYVVAFTFYIQSDSLKVRNWQL